MTSTIVSRICLAIAASIFAATPIAAGQSSSPAAPSDVTITGIVTCTKYVYSKPDRKAFTPAEAIRMCANQGYSYVIVSGRNVYPLEGNKNQLAKLAGEKVTITGHVNTDRPSRNSYTFHDTIDTTKIVSSPN